MPVVMEVKGDVYFYLEADCDGQVFATRRYLLHSEQCKNGEQDLAIMRCKLSDDPDCLSRQQYSVAGDKCSALFDAVYNDHHNCVAFMVSAGANVWEICRWYDIVETCLYRHRYKTLRYLIANNIIGPLFDPNNSGIVNALNASNYYLLVAVKKECTLDIINLFLKLGVQVDVYLNFDLELNHCPFKMPTVCAIETCKPLVLKTLVLHGGKLDHTQIVTAANLSEESQDCLSLVHHFTLFAFTRLQDALLLLLVLHQFGANLWQTNRHGMTPLEVRQNPTALQREILVRRIRQQVSEESEIVASHITAKMEQLMSQPLSLKCWSRIALVRDKVAEYPRFVDNLGNQVPREVVHFLRAEELK